MIRLVPIALSLLIALALVACGPGSGGSAPPGGSTPPASVPAADDGY